MDNLLKLAIEAHSGLERWRRFNMVRVRASIKGGYGADVVQEIFSINDSFSSLAAPR